jgi:hypothetical protein
MRGMWTQRSTKFRRKRGGKKKEKWKGERGKTRIRDQVEGQRSSFTLYVGRRAEKRKARIF